MDGMLGVGDFYALGFSKGVLLMHLCWMPF
jgi:hypothetical protein